jgi:hypothetical protein
MKESAESSFDITLARELSCKLTGQEEAPVSRPHVEDTAEYVRFPRGAPAKPQTAPAQPVAVKEETKPLPPKQFVTWGDLLNWCMESTTATTAFVLDSDGFVVAHMGVEPINGFDGMGAELAYAMEHFSRVDQEAGGLRSVTLVFRERSLFGFHVRITDAVQLVVGLVTGSPVSTDLKERIVNTTILNLSKLM